MSTSDTPSSRGLSAGSRNQRMDPADKPRDDACLKTRLTINGLKLNIYFGWPEDERLRKQLLTLDITIDFPQPPTACETDRLEDTFCYSTLAAAIRTEVSSRHCRLVEHLAREVYLIIKKTIPQQINIGVAITKYPSTITDLQNGITFHYGDM